MKQPKRWSYTRILREFIKWLTVKDQEAYGEKVNIQGAIYFMYYLEDKMNNK